MKLIYSLGLATALIVPGCTGAPDAETIPVGTPVEVVKQDGGVVRGTLAERNAEALKVARGSTSRNVPKKEIAAVRVLDPDKPAPLPAMARFREVTVPAGTSLVVRLGSAVASDTSRLEDAVEGTLSDAIVIDDVDVFPAGSTVKGYVSSVQPAGKVKGRAALAVRFTSIVVAGREGFTPIGAGVDLLAPATKGEDAAKIAVPAAGGAIIGGLIGGKKGAAIGTAIGGGGGTAVVLSTSGAEVRLARGAVVTVRTDDAVDVRVPLSRR